MNPKVYIVNPKTNLSGIVCCIVQKGKCPIRCADCFYNGGRGYLEPLDENTPNIPPDIKENEVLRVNDGNDSNILRELVISQTDFAKNRRFFNTSIPKSFDEPWVLTINPGKIENTSFHEIPKEQTKQLMFVRFVISTLNIDLAKQAIDYYTNIGVPVVLTFRAFFKTNLPIFHEEKYYSEQRRTTNVYYVINFETWDRIMSFHRRNPLVFSCSGPDNFKCSRCGNCLREFYRVKNQKTSGSEKG